MLVLGKSFFPPYDSVWELLAGANYSDSNAAELIISILALIKGEIVIVKTSLIGTILGDLLLVLGTSFIAGGYNRIEQNSTLLLLKFPVVFSPSR